MKVVPDLALLNPVPTASTTAGTANLYAPLGQQGAGQPVFWSPTNADSNPWYQLDLTKILIPYEVDVTLTGVLPSSLVLLGTDDPLQTQMGIRSNTAGDLYPAFDTIATISSPALGSNANKFIFNAVSYRYLRILCPGMNASGGILSIAIYASSNRPNTSARILIGSTFFIGASNSPNAHLQDLVVNEPNVGQGSRTFGSITFKLNNRDELYTDASFPTGTQVICWIEGVVKLLGVLTIFRPKYSKDGFVINGEAKDYGEFLKNQAIRNAWAATTISDTTKTDDVISQGPNSILAQITQSNGGRLFTSVDGTYSNLASTAASPNNLVYFPSQNIDGWTLLGKLADRALDGAWGLQNQNFDQANTFYNTSLKGAQNQTDGYWFTFPTHSVLSVKFTPKGLIDTKGVIIGAYPSASIVQAANNDPHILIPAGIKSYDGGVSREAVYQYAEIFQPCFIKISQINVAGSAYIFPSSVGASGNSYGDPFTLSAGNNQGSSFIIDFMYEGIAANGQVRRFHILDINAVGGLDDSGGTNMGTFPPTDKLQPTAQDSQDVYSTIGSLGTYGYGSAFNLGADWITKFGASASNDIITGVRIRVIPFINSAVTKYAQYAGQVNTLNNFRITLPASIKNPPVNFDYFVGSVISAGKLIPELFWYARPRAGVDTGRNTALSDSLYLNTNPNSAQSNNIVDFELIKGDTFTTKNDILITGEQRVKPNSDESIDAQSSAYINAQYPPHGSPPNEVEIFDQPGMATLGRRKFSKDVPQTDAGAVARQAIDELTKNKAPVTRGIVKIGPGNPRLSTGQVVQLFSDTLTVPPGSWYIIQSTHTWSAKGYMTDLTIAEDRYRFATEFQRIQRELFTASFNYGDDPTKGAAVGINYHKRNADLDGVVIQPSVEKNSTANNQTSIRLPLNFLPEFSGIQRVRVTITQALDKFVSGQLPTIFSRAGWTEMQWNTTTGTEFQMTNLKWFAQRFTFTQSAGKLLFEIGMRIPSGAAIPVGSTLDVSVFNETNRTPVNSPSVLGPTIQQVIETLAGTIFSKPQPGKAESQIQGGFISFPLTNVRVAGTDVVGNSSDTNYHVFEFSSAPGALFQPKSNYWFVMRTTSAGALNVYIAIKNTDNQTSVRTDQSTATDSDHEWGFFTNAGATFNFQAGQTSGFRAWAPDSLANEPVGGVNGGATTKGQGDSSAIKMWEPVTGQAFQAHSLIGQDQQASEISFSTSIVARRNARGQVDVMIPISAGIQSGGTHFFDGTTSSSIVSGVGRLTYACQVDFISFK